MIYNHSIPYVIVFLHPNDDAGPSNKLRGAASNSRVNSFASAALDDEADTSPLPSCAMRDMSLVPGAGGEELWQS